MAILRTFINEAEAEIAASAVEAAGIEVTIHSDSGGGIYPSLDMYGIQLIVPDKDLEAANDVLNNFAVDTSEERAPEE